MRILITHNTKTKNLEMELRKPGQLTQYARQN